VKFEKELVKERDQVVKVKYDQAQRIKQQRLFERQRIEEEIQRRNEEQAAKKRAQERMIEEQQRGREILLK
jgi:hypothetical protein